MIYRTSNLKWLSTTKKLHCNQSTAVVLKTEQPLDAACSCLLKKNLPTPLSCLLLDQNVCLNRLPHSWVEVYRKQTTFMGCFSLYTSMLVGFLAQKCDVSLVCSEVFVQRCCCFIENLKDNQTWPYFWPFKGLPFHHCIWLPSKLRDKTETFSRLHCGRGGEQGSWGEAACILKQSRTQGVIIGDMETQMVQGRPAVSAVALLAKP